MSKKNIKSDSPDSTMSFGDHLEELRGRLIYALIGLTVGMIVGLCFAKQAINLLQKPYLKAIAANSANVTEQTKTSEQNDQFLLQTLAPADGFISYIKIAMVTGLLISSPWVFYHLWMFIAAGLYNHEKKYVHMAAPFSAVLFVTGALFFLIVVAPLTLNFLIGFNRSFLGVKSQFTFQYYISFITHLMLVFGVAFQTPTAIYFLNRVGLVSIDALCRSRKYVLLAIFIVSAMATPPDPLSQVTLAIPLYLLFELGILISYLGNRKRTDSQLEKSDSE